MGNEEAQELYTERWASEGEYTQIRWDELYKINWMNNYMTQLGDPEKGSTYILE